MHVSPHPTVFKTNKQIINTVTLNADKGKCIPMNFIYYLFNDTPSSNNTALNGKTIVGQLNKLEEIRNEALIP
jgi:hypothetical protein